MIFDYFFLKLYNGTLKSSMPEFPRALPSLVLSLTIVVNLMIIDGFLAKLDILPSVFFHKYTVVISLIIMFIFLLLRYKNKRIAEIKIKFASDEFKPRKKILNIAFVLYLVLTYILVFLVASYKPGYLPKLFD